jgi:hypothetical protein
VIDDVLTMEELRRRRAEILGVARKRRAHRIAVFGSVAKDLQWRRLRVLLAGRRGYALCRVMRYPDGGV